MSKDISPGRKDRILRLLEQLGSWCSGEDMSAWLGISRAAIAKHVATLREEGHVIASATRRGYRLLIENEPLDVEAVKRYLRTKNLGRSQWLLLEETGSTNTEAVLLASDGAPEGTVVIAEKQTRGRGRKGHAWFTPPRGLQFSLIMRPDETAMKPSQGSALTAARSGLAFSSRLTSLAAKVVAAEVEEAAGLAAEFKKPNDVLVNGKKVCGILVETGFRGNELDWAVLGIGLNVNALAEDFPPELADKVSSLYAETGRALSRNIFLAGLLNRLEEACAR